MLNKRALKSGFFLGLIGTISIIFVIITQVDTSDKIENNQNQQLFKMFSFLLPNDVDLKGTSLTCHLITHKYIGHKMKAYSIYKDNKSLGYVMLFTTGKGYANPLILIAGLDKDKNINKLDVYISKETPGIGDKVTRKKSHFLDQLNEIKLSDHKVFDVKKYGGDFDGITGATITSRAIIHAAGDLLDNVKQIDFDSFPKCK